MNQKTITALDQTGTARNDAPNSIVSWTDHGGPNQLWSFEHVDFPIMYWLVSASFGPDHDHVLQWEPSTSDAVSVDVKTGQPKKTQLWYLEEAPDRQNYYTIRNVAYEDKVLDLAGSNNSTVLGWNEKGGENQKWALTDVDFNGYE